METCPDCRRSFPHGGLLNVFVERGGQWTQQRLCRECGQRATQGLYTLEVRPRKKWWQFWKCEAPPVAGRAGQSWEAIADDFNRHELPKEHPDFACLHLQLGPITAYNRHAAWLAVGHAFRARGDGRRALQCFIEGFMQEPIQYSVTWHWISRMLPASDAQMQELRTRAQRAQYSSEIGEIRQLSHEVRSLIGKPGDPCDLDVGLS